MYYRASCKIKRYKGVLFSEMLYNSDFYIKLYLTAGKISKQLITLCLVS